MENIFKLKDFANGKSYKARAILQSDFVLENRQTIADNIAAQVKAQGGETEIGITGHIIQVKGGNQFWNLPTLPREREGIVTFRSKDFIFEFHSKGNKSYCDKPKAVDIRAYGFDTVNFRGEVTQWHLTAIEESNNAT